VLGDIDEDLREVERILKESKKTCGGIAKEFMTKNPLEVISSPNDTLPSFLSCLLDKF